MSVVVPGSLHPSNSRCVLDWGHSGQIVYGCHHLIFIVDATSQNRECVLDLHKAAVTHVLFGPQSAALGEHRPIRLASADISGQIIISDPRTAIRRSSFFLNNAQVLTLHWFAWKDLQRDFLIVLHSTNALILWNADTGEKVWQYQFNGSVTEFVLDPFNAENAIFVVNENSLLIFNDIDLNVAPSGSAKFVVIPDVSEGGIIEVEYHKAYHNVVFASSKNTVYCINQELCCIFFKVDAECPLLRILPIQDRDVFLSVSSNGSFSAWLGSYTPPKERQDAQLRYERIALSEGVRGASVRSGAGVRLVAACLCPATMTAIALLYSNGKIIIWQLESDTILNSGIYRSVFSEELFSFDQTLKTNAIGKLSFRQIAICSALAAGVSCIRVRPLENLQNEAVIGQDLAEDFDDRHLAAIGTASGILHLVDVFTRAIVKEYMVQSSPIRCIEWASPFSVITAGFNHPLSTTNAVRNDIFITDIRTGISRRMRPEADESPVTMLRVSFYQSYLALSFEREPLEVWDVRSMRLLRRMSKSCPIIRDMAWSCKHCTVKTAEGTAHPVFRENLVVLDTDNRLYHIVVKGLHVRDGKEVSTQWKPGSWTIRCMAWKGDILAMGDADGRLAVWDLAKKSSRNARIQRSPVLRMQFSRLTGDHSLAVLHRTDLLLWDTESLTCSHSIKLDASRAALDVDLCGITPIFLTNDNMMWYALDATTLTTSIKKDSNSSLVNSAADPLREKLFADLPTGNEAFETFISRKKSTLSADLPENLVALHKEYIYRRFIGDRAICDILQTALHFLQADENSVLPPHLQNFWNGATYKERESQVVIACCTIHDANEERLVENAVVIGGTARRAAVDRLIGSASGDIRLCSFKAALLVSAHDDDHAKSVIKLIATNLIASDLIEDGVELLFLVGAGIDACRYLQSQRQWHRSVKYAKIGLTDADAERVFEKVAAFVAVDQKSQSVLWECANQQWQRVRQLLASSASLNHLSEYFFTS